LPKYNQFQWPIIVALRALGGSATIEELDSRVLTDGAYTEEQQAVLHNDGPKTEIEYRLAWGRTYLKGMGLATNSERGVWSLVGPGAVRDFRGAMAGRGDKGLLITTGTFTSDAKVEATRDGAPPIDLIDGARLCDLLKNHRMGVDVRERVEEDVSVDAGFFGHGF
jgi:restriction system protein